jgi:hypothetical protein
MTTGGSEGGDLVLHFRRSSQVRESEVLLLGPFAAPKPHAANLHLGFPPPNGPAAAGSQSQASKLQQSRRPPLGCRGPDFRATR